MEKEMLNKARWVSEMMKEDGITSAHIEKKTDDERVELSMAYMAAIERKIVQIQNEYLTNAEAKKAMQESILAIM